MKTSAFYTFWGMFAILLWASLAYLTLLTHALPPFEWLALTFGLATFIFAMGLLRKKRVSVVLSAFNVKALFFSSGGIFIYHALYFLALKLSPPAEASLILYLWPLLIVLFTGLLPQGHLTIWHVIGTVMGFSGAGFLVLGEEDHFSFEMQNALGYGIALLGAFVWSGYSVLNRRFREGPPEAMVFTLGFCAVLALIISLLYENMLWPTPKEWLGLIGLALGPMGLAFFAWDLGTKKGSIRLLGIAAYFTPLLSTLLLILLGKAEPNWFLGLACLLITLGALIASWGERKPG